MSYEADQSQLVPDSAPARLVDAPPSVSDTLSTFGFGASQTANDRLMLRHLLLQSPLTPEALAVAAAVRNSGLQASLMEAPVTDLPRFAHHLTTGCCLPIGTPEFMRKAKSIAGILQTEWVRCPNQLSGFLLQPTLCVHASASLAMRRPLIISPHSGTTFEPFLLTAADAQMDGQARAQLARLLQLPPATLVYAAAAQNIQASWRYYVVRGEVVGFARIAQHDGPPGMSPDIEDVSAMVAATPADTAYALDVGSLRDGATTLLGVQDPLDVQLIPTGADRPSNYDFLRML